MGREIPLSALRDVAVLFPGDLHELGLFVCQAFDARDRETNARNAGVRVGPSRPTLHGLAARYANVTNIELRRIEGMLVEAGFSLGAIVECDAADSADGTGLPQGQVVFDPLQPSTLAFILKRDPPRPGSVSARQPCNTVGLVPRRRKA